VEKFVLEITSENYFLREKVKLITIHCTLTICIDSVVQLSTW